MAHNVDVALNADAVPNANVDRRSSIMKESFHQNRIRQRNKQLLAMAVEKIRLSNRTYENRSQFSNQSRAAEDEESDV